MPRKRSDTHLTKLAINYAIREREDFLAAISGSDPETEARVQSLINEWKALLERKYGERADVDVEREAEAAAPRISIFELAKRTQDQ